MILVFNITEWHTTDDIKTVGYGIGNATLSQVHYVYQGPDDALIHSIKGTYISEIEEELFSMGFVKLDVHVEELAK